jgi:glycosyltransferase involved in cell wall biosynthesis
MVTTFYSAKQGVPVIARDLGPFGEIVEKSGGGLLFSNRQELADAVNRMAEDREFSRQLGASAKRRLEDLWMEDPVIPHYFDLIRRIARQRNKDQVLEILGTAGPADRGEAEKGIDPSEAAR